MAVFTTSLEVFPATLAVPAEVTPGAPLLVDRLDAIQIQISGTFVLTIQFQVSLDGVIWVNEGTPVTAPGLLQIAGPFQFLRADVTAFTSGAAVAIVDGQGYGDQ